MKYFFQYLILLPIFAVGGVSLYKPCINDSAEYHPDKEQIVIFSDSIPDPNVKIGNYLDSILSVRQILLNPFLSVPSHVAGGAKYSVHHFEMEIEYLSGETVSTRQNGFQFSTAQLKLIKALKPGDKLHFSDLRGKDTGGKSGRFPNFTITII